MTAGSNSTTAEIDNPAIWVDRYGDMLVQYAYARLGALDSAEDAVQETFLAAWRARGTFDGRSSLRTWLVGILRRKIADHYRRAGRDGRRVADQSADAYDEEFTAAGGWANPVARWTQTPDQLAENGEFWKVFEHCLDALPAHFAQAFHLREIRQSSVDEVCRVTDVTPQNLAVRLHRARTLLRSCLQRKWFAPYDGE
jgi:RNA polymerase sigma-70 factor (ECF subfamily)